MIRRLAPAQPSRALEGHVRRRAERDRDLRLLGGQPLAGAQVAGHAGPAPRRHLDAQRGVGVGARAVRDALLLGVALVLAEHGVGRARSGRSERSTFRRSARSSSPATRAGASMSVSASSCSRWFCADVAQRAGAVVELAAAVDAAVLGDRDLDRLDRAAVPQRLEDAVDEAQHEQVLRRLLAEVVVDPQQLLLVEVLVQRGAQLVGAREVLPERLLDHQARGGAGLAPEPDPGEPAGDLREQRRGDGEVGEPVALAAVERRLEALVERRVVRGAVDDLGRRQQPLPALGRLAPGAAGARARRRARAAPPWRPSARRRGRRGPRAAGRTRRGRGGRARAWSGRGRPSPRTGRGSSDVGHPPAASCMARSRTHGDEEESCGVRLRDRGGRVGRLRARQPADRGSGRARSCSSRPGRPTPPTSSTSRRRSARSSAPSTTGTT